MSERTVSYISCERKASICRRFFFVSWVILLQSLVKLIGTILTDVKVSKSVIVHMNDYLNISFLKADC